ncbi:hypothetical protein DIPPA_35501 [Diplonema papillatum]|nr:hypothetical protein DIPPA_35501 [Diplonema papillatum]
MQDVCSDVRGLANGSSELLEQALARLCSEVTGLRSRVEHLEQEGECLQLTVATQAAKIGALEAAAGAAGAALETVGDTRERVSALERSVAATFWADVAVRGNPEPFDPNGLYRVSLEEPVNASQQLWVYPNRVHRQCLVFEPGSPSGAQYFGRIAQDKKYRWEYFSKSSESITAPSIPIAGSVYKMQVACF